MTIPLAALAVADLHAGEATPGGCSWPTMAVSTTARIRQFILLDGLAAFVHGGNWAKQRTATGASRLESCYASVAPEPPISFGKSFLVDVHGGLELQAREHGREHVSDFQIAVYSFFTTTRPVESTNT